jgi:threonylcarbamoyladenosine tRNA methylthiotransferase MtaB
VAPAFHIENFGCRAARADGEAVGDRLRAGGLSESHPTVADVVIVNTCSVTAEADRAARAFIRRARRLNPEARILVTGCYAQRAPAELAGLAGVSAVVGNSHKALVPKIALDLLEARVLQQSENDLIQIQAATATLAPPQVVWADDRFAHSFLEEAQLVPGEQTRPNLKIQEGCGNRCTFCVIPQTRGSSRSLPTDAVLRQVEGFVASGGNELVLSGINLGRWGRERAREVDPPEPSLASLVRRIFAETALPRLRLSSVEPMDWDPDLIGLMRDYGGSRLARHAHLPLQSGSDAVLRRMHRRYRPWHYAEKAAALLDAAGPALTLGADVMVGFPGESDREFDETCAFIRALPFGYLHLFPFSPRPGTRGWALHAESPVPARAVEDRMAALRVLAAEKSESHRTQFVGRNVDAITLHTPATLQRQGRTAALTENFLPAEIDAPLPANQLVRLRVTGLNADQILQTTVPGDGSVQQQRKSPFCLSETCSL